MTNAWHTLTILIFISLFYPQHISAEGRDLHLLWEDRCGDCHGHAGEFARDHLQIKDGILQGRHHTDDFVDFMKSHYLVQTELDAVLTMLAAQVTTPPRYKQECSSCHDLAAHFVRESMELRDGVLYSRKSGRPVREFLQSHRNLTSSDVDFYMQQLTRIAREVFRP